MGFFWHSSFFGSYLGLAINSWPQQLQFKKRFLGHFERSEMGHFCSQPTVLRLFTRQKYYYRFSGN